MKKKLLLAMLITAAALGGILQSAKPAHAAELGDACTTGTGRSGYILASGRTGALTCVAPGEEEE